MEQTNPFQKQEPLCEEIIRGEHDEVINELLNKIHSYLLKNRDYNLKSREDTLRLCRDFRGFVFSMNSIYVMEHFAEIYNIEIPHYTNDNLMSQVNGFFEILKKKKLEDDYIDLVQWIIMRPFTFQRFLKASWDNQPILFVDGKRKSK